jgi:hypothetical protein
VKTSNPKQEPTRHDTGRREKVQRQRCTDIVIELLILQRRSTYIRVRKFIILLANEHHDAHRICAPFISLLLSPLPHLHTYYH